MGELLEIGRQEVGDALADLVRVIAVRAVQCTFEDLVRLLLHRERELTLAHGARENLHEVPVHEGAERTVGDKGSAARQGWPRTLLGWIRPGPSQPRESRWSAATRWSSSSSFRQSLGRR